MTYEKQTRTPRGRPEKRAPKGYHCLGCGQFHRFPAYVFAHWREELHNACDQCGMRHAIFSGRAFPAVRGWRAMWFKLIYREFLRSAK